MVSLHYTGHPLFDVGLATITAFVRKEDPAELTLDNLNEIADYIERYYTHPSLSSFLTLSLINSAFTNPAYKDKPELREEYARLVARSFGPNIPKSEELCVFTGQPAIALSLSLKEGKDELPPGRAYRQHIPLITGEGIINFSAWGDSGLPVSGEALLCLQFFPMGCYKCGGRLLAIHSDNSEIILNSARKALHQNMNTISQVIAQGDIKLPDAPATARTLLVNTLLEMDLEQRHQRKASQPYSIAAYHITNGKASLDEKNPPLKIYQLPLEIVRFLLIFNHPDYQVACKELIKRGWEFAKPSKAVPEGTRSLPAERQRNYLFEDIFRLPENGRSFLRMYLLRIPKRNTTQTDPRSNYNPRKEADLISWKLTEFFLQEVIRMDKERIDEIRNLGDRLSTYIKEQNDKRFFLYFYKVQRYDDLRTLLIRANYKYVKAGKAPLITFNPYLTVFEEGNEVMRPDWKFARDLVLICMIEQLHNKHWFDENPDAFPDDKEIDTALTESEQ